MKKEVYLLQHAYSYGKSLEHEEVKTIGIYSSKETAQAVIEKYRFLSGFNAYDVSCFHIDRYILDDSDWKEGFIMSDVKG